MLEFVPIGLLCESSEAKFSKVKRSDLPPLPEGGHWAMVRGRPVYFSDDLYKKIPKPTPKPKPEKVVKYEDKDGVEQTKNIYPAWWREKQKKIKFTRSKILAGDMGRVDRDTAKECGNKDPRKAAIATALRIMSFTGMRAGSKEHGLTKGEPTYATVDLQRGDVEILGDEVSFSFRGKAGVEHHHTMRDKATADSLRRFLGGDKAKGREAEPLFQWEEQKKGQEPQRKVLNEGLCRKRMKKWKKGYLLKDFRTLKANDEATQEALAVIAQFGKMTFATKKEAKKFAEMQIRKVCTRVARALGHDEPETSNTAKLNYISPDIFHMMMRELGVP